MIRQKLKQFVLSLQPDIIIQMWNKYHFFTGEIVFPIDEAMMRIQDSYLMGSSLVVIDLDQLRIKEDSYFTFAKGVAISFRNIDDCRSIISVEELIDEIIKNDDDFGLSELRELLDENMSA